MEQKLEFELIITIVNSGFSSLVVDSAKEAGAGGATLIKGRGTGIRETNNFLGVQIQPEKDIVIILTPKEDRNKIMQAICKSAGLNTEGQGLCFSVPVEDWSGICHLNNMVSSEDNQSEQLSNAKNDDETMREMDAQNEEKSTKLSKSESDTSVQ